MQYMKSEWRDRLELWLDALKRDLYHPLGNIEVEAFCTMDRLTPEEAAKGPFAPMGAGTAWGDTWEYCWMRARIVLPEEARGQRVVMDLPAGGETTIFVDGRSFGTYRAQWVDVPYHFIEDNWLTRSGEPGRAYDLLMEVYAGHFYPENPITSDATGPVLPGDYQDPLAGKKRAVLGRLTYGLWNEDAYQLLMDMETLRLLGDQLDPESLRADKVARALERATLIADPEQPPEERAASYRAAREALRPALEAKNGSTAPVFYAIGNAHIDLAWLWPMEETRRKTSRTFAAQLRHLEEYPDYKYLQSQPAAYEMCRECYPELFERILAAIREGRWIPEGAMWVEPDTNMTSGESLVRQLVHGKRYYKEVLGVDSVMLWLPDSFGYSAALPQLLKAAGVKYLVTQKIFWSYNDGERFPHHYFTWRGADGSSIDTFLPTSYTYRTHPQEICETWKDRAQKRDLDAFLFPFGYGDGGGGSSRDFMEFLDREKDLEGMPRVKQASPIDFFRDMEEQGGPKRTYAGELYFSAHRGVYTSQAAIKRGNRKGELALREAEMWGALASLQGAEYPLARMDAAWKKLLLNQFHDILPGSSIARVYEDARRDHRWIIAEADAVRDDMLSAMLQPGDGVTVFNSLSFDRTGLVALPAAFAGGAVTDEGEAVPVRSTADGALALVSVPACGAVSLLPRKAEADFEPVRAALEDGEITLENGVVSVRINARGEVVSFIDEDSGRQFAAGPMNRLLAYKDVPRKFDAWDIDSNYIELPVALDGPVALEIVEAGGLRAVVRLRRRVMHSDFEQDIVLEAGSRRLEFRTRVNWRELHRLLKVEFPVDVRADEAYNEIQFGFMKRPTHRSRQYDLDRFEVCNQRYTALCDEAHGAAVLNDCKYGVSMEDNAIRLTLLRAAASPEMRADNGEQEFTYAFVAWEGSFLDSPVVAEACELNVPMRVAPGVCPAFSAFAVDEPNVFIDTVKPAEDGSGDIILRVYEAKRADTDCVLYLNLPCERVWACDLLENPLEELDVQEDCVALRFHTFEVKTLRVRIAEQN